MVANLLHIHPIVNSPLSPQPDLNCGEGGGKGRTHSRDRKLRKQKLWEQHREVVLSIESQQKAEGNHNIHNLFAELSHSVVLFDQVSELLEAWWEYRGKELGKAIKHWSHKEITVIAAGGKTRSVKLRIPTYTDGSRPHVIAENKNRLPAAMMKLIGWMLASGMSHRTLLEGLLEHFGVRMGSDTLCKIHREFDGERHDWNGRDLSTKSYEALMVDAAWFSLFQGLGYRVDMHPSWA